ncbi:conserved uncharacterized protein [Desulfococcus multivorans]|nr:conserved uncharacterized protein [Desulfococcus multivorans]
MTGHFDGTATFGAGEANETELTSAGNIDSDIFIAKYDRNGGIVWARQAGGIDWDRGSGIAVDQWGNSYVTGHFMGTATFGAGEGNETELTSTGYQDIFIAKYNRNGRLIWAKQAGGIDWDSDSGNAVAVDKWGNSYVTGDFQGTATFGAGEANETVLTSTGYREIFIAKYDRNGGLVWAKQASGTNGYNYSSDIAVDKWGNSYVTGDFMDTATFGAGEANETELTTSDGDIFIAKYDRNGRLIWAKQAGDIDWDRGSAIAVDKWGNSYITGFFAGTATFGTGEANEIELISAGYQDIFIAKYDRNGGLVWAKQTSGPGGYEDGGSGIAVDKWGNSYVTGDFQGTATFGAGEANETALTSANPSGSDGDGADIFIAKYDRNGRLVWATQAGGFSLDTGTDIALDRWGNIYVTGGFWNAAVFGAGEANETALTSAGQVDIFIAKYKNGKEALPVSQKIPSIRFK